MITDASDEKGTEMCLLTWGIYNDQDSSGGRAKLRVTKV